MCLALSSLRALGELRCQETTRHRSVSSCPNNVNLLFPASFHHFRFGLTRSSASVVNSCIRLLRPPTPPTRNLCLQNILSGLKTIRSNSISLYFLFSFLSSYQKFFFRSHFAFKKRGLRRSFLRGKQLPNRRIIRAFKTSLNEKNARAITFTALIKLHFGPRSEIIWIIN